LAVLVLLVIVVGFEAVAGGKVITYWFHAPLWLLSLILMIAMTATNLFSVASYGEFEFWFAGIKVATIVVFLGIGTLFVLGVWPHRHRDFGNLTAHGGFFPNGVGAMFAAVVVVIFSMVGAEGHDRRRRNRRPGTGGPPGDQHRRDPHRGLLRRLGLAAGGDCAVELGGARGVAVRGRFAPDGDPRRRELHERRRPDRGAVLPELRAVHRVACCSCSPLDRRRPPGWSA
jgi:amino acid permease-like protein